MDIVFDSSLVLYAPLYKLDGEQFMSKDVYGHICRTSPNPATASKWRFYGRDFNAVNNYISCGDSLVLANVFDGGATAIAWIYPKSDGENDHGVIIDKERWRFNVDEETAGAVKLRFYYDFDGIGNGVWIQRTATVSLNTWDYVAVTYDNSDVGKVPIFYTGTTRFAGSGGINAITEVIAPVGDRVNDASDVLFIGSDNISNQTFDGYIGECMLYNRILPPQEIYQNYIATKGRYQ